ncbi:MAG: hypothetical protein ACM30G_06440 [Micromonosporaceae bacterium]
MSRRSLKWLAVGAGVLVVAVAVTVAVRRALSIGEDDRLPDLPEPAAEPEGALAATR